MERKFLLGTYDDGTTTPEMQMATSRIRIMRTKMKLKLQLMRKLQVKAKVKLVAVSSMEIVMTIRAKSWQPRSPQLTAALELCRDSHITTKPTHSYSSVHHTYIYVEQPRAQALQTLVSRAASAIY